MQNRLIQALKAKIFLILFLPAVGLVYFSSDYVYKSYENYRNTLYLRKLVDYSELTLELIDSLQKERGLGATYLSDEHFLSKYLAQQKRSDDVIKRYFHFIATFSIPQYDLKGIVEKLSNLDDIRQKTMRKSVDLLHELQCYSALIELLLKSTDLLSKKDIDQPLYRYIHSFALLLQLTEINGQERALIGYMLQYPTIDRKLLRKILYLDIEEQAIRDLLKKESPIDLDILMQELLPKAYRKRFYELKKHIIYSHNFQAVSKEEWWKEATRFIDRLFAIERQLLKKIRDYQKQLHRKTLRALWISVALWVLSLVALLLFLKLFNKMLQDLLHYFHRLELEKRFYKAISEFNEQVFFAKSFDALISDFSLILYKTDFFEFLYVLDCQSDKIVGTENISVQMIEAKIPQKIKRSIQEVKERSAYKILYCNEFDTSEAFGVFPVLVEDRCRYILVLAVKGSYHFDEKLIDLVYKMVDLFGFAYHKLQIEKEEERLKAALKLLSYTFDSHEAITITDESGKILRVNKAFEKITGYKEEEVKGKNPSILKSGKHDKAFYQKMWEKIKKEGFWKGEIYNKKKDGTIYPEVLAITAVKDENGEITNYVAHFYDITDLKKAQEEVLYRATHDILTELYNRQTLLEKIDVVRKEVLKEERLCAFFFIDVDDFKKINDTYGHALGDKVLIKVAEILKGVAKESDIVARIAGDEFGFVLMDAGETLQEAMQSATILAQKILELVEQPFRIEDIEIHIGLSIGIYIFPSSEKDVEDIILGADIAMYHSKKSGKNSFSFFNEELDLVSKQFLLKKRALEEGIEEGRLQLFYQPKVAIENGQIVGFEGLVRLQEGEDLRYPQEILPYAKGNKLMQQISEVVLKEALNTLEKWRDFDGYISVNLATELFLNHHFMDRLFGWIDHPKSSSLRIELLEDGYIQDLDYAKRQIEKLRSFGVECAIDDFGTGYASLHLLRDLPLKEVKIDKSFIINLFDHNNEVIVEKMVEIAKVFGYEVCVEGVESREVLRRINGFGCDTFQGFLFSRPVKKEIARKFIDAAS